MIRTVVGQLQKGKDFGDYVYHRGAMLLQFHLRRLRHRLVFRGTVDSILIIRLGSIGDVIRATAIVEALHDRYPMAHIDLLTSELTRPLVEAHPNVRAVYVPGDLQRLGTYDWVINLQNIYPLDTFLRPSDLRYQDVLKHVSSCLGARTVSGRSWKNDREVSPTNILYCRSEMEELFLISLLDFNFDEYPRTEIRFDPTTTAAARARFPLPDRPLLGVFIGSNSVGCGSDEGFRTYSIDYVTRLVDHFSKRFTVVMIGQSNVRTADEQRQYRDMLRARPGVIDLVDQTTLQELATVMDRFEVLIACDSSPIHLAQARGVPVVALYVMDGTFRLGPRLEYQTVIGLNSATPCFRYTWRWKYFCGSCRDPRTRAAYCHNDTYAFGVDRIGLDRIDDAVARLQRARPTLQTAKP